MCLIVIEEYIFLEEVCVVWSVVLQLYDLVLVVVDGGENGVCFVDFGVGCFVLMDE